MPDPTPGFADVLLYDAAWAPSPRRLRWALAEKGVRLPVREVDLRRGEHLSAEALVENPNATIPALRLPDGSLVADSLAIARYVEAVRPDPPLFGRTPTEIAQVEFWLHRVDGEGYRQIADWYRNGHPAFRDRPLSGARLTDTPQITALAERGETLWRRFVAGLESELREGEWLIACGFTMADIALAVACDFADQVGLDWAAGPRLTEWRARASLRPGAVA